MEKQIQDILHNAFLIRIFYIIIGVVSIWLLIKIIQKRWLSKIHDSDSRYRSTKVSSFIGYFATLILFFVVYSDKLGGFTVALGVAGAGIAFALQEVIASFAGWLAIMFGGFYKPGDRVQLGGIKGDVMDIGVLRTTIMETGQWVDGDLYNGRIVLIANSFVFKEPVFNYSGDFPFLWDEIKIPIRYGSNYTKTRELLENIGNEVAGNLTEQSSKQWISLQHKYMLEDAQTDPMVSMIATDNWVEFTLRYIVHYKKRRATKTALFTQILSSIEATEGEIKFASTTIQLVDSPAIQVKSTTEEKK